MRWVQCGVAWGASNFAWRRAPWATEGSFWHSRCLGKRGERCEAATLLCPPLPRRLPCPTAFASWRSRSKSGRLCDGERTRGLTVPEAVFSRVQRGRNGAASPTTFGGWMRSLGDFSRPARFDPSRRKVSKQALPVSQPGCSGDRSTRCMSPASCCDSPEERRTVRTAADDGCQPNQNPMAKFVITPRVVKPARRHQNFSFRRLSVGPSGPLGGASQRVRVSVLS